MADLFISPFQRALSANGTPLSGAKLYFYTTGTLNLADVYTADDLATPHPNPVVADAGGQFEAIYLDPAVAYRAVLKTSANVTIQDIDPYREVAPDADYVIQVSFVGTPEPQQVFAGHVFDRAVTLPADLPSANFWHVSGPPAGSTAVAMLNEGVQFGTLTIGITGTVTIDSTEADFDEGDALTFQAPAGATTFVNLFGAMRGVTQ